MNKYNKTLVTGSAGFLGSHLCERLLARGDDVLAEKMAQRSGEKLSRAPHTWRWVPSFPIPLRILFAAHPGLLTPVLRVLHRVIAGFLLKQAGLKRTTADTGAVTLVQRFGSAANPNNPSALPGTFRLTPCRVGDIDLGEGKRWFEFPIREAPE